MLRIDFISSFEGLENFISSFEKDTHFSNPMLITKEQYEKNLWNTIKSERYLVMKVVDGKKIIGLFVFVHEKDEKYLEMIVGLSREKSAYEIICHYIFEVYRGYQVDFVFNPQNIYLKEVLKSYPSVFYPEQWKMIFSSPVEYKSNKQIELIDSLYEEQYVAMHQKDMYWTGDKVLKAQNRFRTFVALVDEKVVGYLDVTYCFEENEPYDLFVLEHYRHQGFGKALLFEALKQNAPKKMMLLVDYNNDIAIHLYESLGFTRCKKEDCQTVHASIMDKKVLMTQRR